MRHANEPGKDPLPVTAELGDEGGSYGDGTLQTETFRGEEGNRRVDPKRDGPTGGDAAAIASEGEQVGPSEAEVRPATDPPDRNR